MGAALPCLSVCLSGFVCLGHRYIELFAANEAPGPIRRGAGSGPGGQGARGRGGGRGGSNSGGSASGDGGGSESRNGWFVSSYFFQSAALFLKCPSLTVTSFSSMVHFFDQFVLNFVSVFKSSCSKSKMYFVPYYGGRKNAKSPFEVFRHCATFSIFHFTKGVVL